MKYRWAISVTTVSSRLTNLLPESLKYIRDAGFPSPTIYIDGDTNPTKWKEHFGLPVVSRTENIRTAGHWHLTALETYIRNREAEIYAFFQDDLALNVNVREYLERTIDYGADRYYNLYTANSNNLLIPMEIENTNGRLVRKVGWFKSNQFGRGAVALVFTKPVLIALLSSYEFVTRHQDAHRGWRAVDGGIVDALKKVGIEEWVHNPSLAQHRGAESSMANQKHKPAATFVSQHHDALSYLDL